MVVESFKTEEQCKDNARADGSYTAGLYGVDDKLVEHRVRIRSCRMSFGSEQLRKSRS